MISKTWSTEDAIKVCMFIEEIAPQYGAHVALTGGTLYKEGPRKDLDILFYRIRQVTKIDEGGLLNALSRCGFEITDRFGWLVKAKLYEKDVDLFFPETTNTSNSKSPGGKY